VNSSDTLRTGWVVHCDGGARGNPGPAGFGFVICDADGEEVYSRGEFVGNATNNVAEYRGLIAAARQVAELGGRSVTFRVDSQLLQRQVTGQYRVKAAHLKPLHADLMQALRAVPGWSVEHVRREHNRHADKLVNQAIDARGVVV
jgi:ribonuclease HI